MMQRPLRIPFIVSLLGGAALLITAIVLAQIERPPVASNQRGIRGIGAFDVYNPRVRADQVVANEIPPSVPYAGGVGPKAGTFYKNVKVLGDVDHGEFSRLMVNMTTWVTPDKGCAGCHNVADFADDSLYTKVVSRRMLEMVRQINTDWTAHVAQTGVTCYTCHRGQLVPPNTWFNNPGPKQAGGLSQKPAGQNHPTAIVGVSALPLDPFTPFLEQANELRVQGTTALKTGNRNSIKQTEWTYALMLNMSQALGVNCNFCHNTRAFGPWAGNPPQRVTAWHGIRMVRDLNNKYINPLKSVLPPERLGVAFGDVPKINCATCHNGVSKPLFGVSILLEFPELKAPAPQIGASR